MTDSRPGASGGARIRQRLKPAMFRALGLLEGLDRRRFELESPPGFIIGPPRSGTTLTRQLLSIGLDTSYFTNLTSSSVFAIDRPLPIMTTRLARLVDSSGGRGRFTSDHGRIDGPGAPAEGERIWETWFGTRYGPVAAGALDSAQRAAMYRAVAAVESIGRAPFVNKTTALSLRIEALCEVFENAYFLRVRRDALDTAQSIHIARSTKYPDWIGPQPAECVGMEDADLVDQVCAQVVHTELQIDRSTSTVGADRFLDVHYREVCADPAAQLNRIADFMRMRGARVGEAQPVPASFTLSSGQKVDDETYVRLRDGLASLAG